MGIIFKILLALHITGGGIGLTAGTINMFRKKGDRLHKLAGMFFLYGMLTAATAALALSVIHPSNFLFITGVFTIYMVSTGQRYLLRRSTEGSAKPLDYTLTYGMLCFGGAFIGFGIYKLILGNTFGIVFIAFGLISLRMVMADIQNYKEQPGAKSNWLSVHIQRMVGGYIAATTAFLVVNLPMTILPANLSFIPWLAPTALLTPFIFIWVKKYAPKKKQPNFE
jgi:uncharacterized membrane protein